MSIATLEKFLPENTLPFLKIWFGEHAIHINITKNRNSKLGDYRKMPDKSHKITINSTLHPELFFFVLTHELAHLIAFEEFGRRILPHGKEWKDTFRKMLLESIEIYSIDLRPIIIKFSRSPKANFMASTDLVRYFHTENYKDEENFIDDLQIGEQFVYRKKNYLLEQKLKKDYLCTKLENGKKYIFKPLVRVVKAN